MTLTDPARPAAKTTTRTGYNVCTICDIGCQVRTTTEIYTRSIVGSVRCV